MKSSNFTTNVRHLLDVKEKWFVNASSAIIPREVEGLLQLGEGFCLPNFNKEKSTIECIKAVENNLSRFGLRDNNTFRNKIFPLIKSIKNNSPNNIKLNEDISSAVSVTKEFISCNPNVLFTRADKGNTVVALDRDDYLDKMVSSLNDRNTYSLVQRNPINKILEDLKRMIKRWQQNEYISDTTFSRLNFSNAILPRAYGLPKIHKPGLPLRIIVSSTGSPLHNLATFLQKILNECLT